MLKNLKIYYVFVSLPFVMLLIGAAVFFEGIKYTISRNPHPQINYTIFVIILVGGIIILFNSRRLMREAKTIVDFSKAIHAKTDSASLKERVNSYVGDLACITQMVAASADRSISHQEQAALEHELSNVRSRLNRRNALPQYLTGLLVGMGLLGTFIGLLATLNDISVLITSFADLDMETVNPIQVFGTMIERMKAPMQSMAIAFSASMFGLLGSIILGLMMVGIRRLQNDISSLLSSEVARHIEIALSFESISLRSGGEVSKRDLSNVDLSTEILLRIEERLAESARVRQRALSAEIDDFKKQRGEMLRALGEQTEANNNFRNDLHLLTNQLGNVLSAMEKGNNEISGQISDLTVHLTGNAKETHKLLARQVDEQQELRSALDSYKIDERLAESTRLQQRTLSSIVDDLKKQRDDMLHTLTDQTAANDNFRAELQQLNNMLGSALYAMEKDNEEISNQISELTVRMASDAKQSHILLGNINSNFSSEIQQLGNRLGGQLENVSDGSEKGKNQLAEQISQLASQLDGSARESQQKIGETSEALSRELQQLGTSLNNISSLTDDGNKKLADLFSELLADIDASAKESRNRLDDTRDKLREELKQLDGRLESISNISESGDDKLINKISDLISKIEDLTKDSDKQLNTAIDNLLNELQQLGNKLSTISNLTEKGADEIGNRISQLAAYMAEANEPPKLPDDAEKKPDTLT